MDRVLQHAPARWDETMGALFPAWSNTAYRLGLAVLALAPVVFIMALMVYVRTPWNTDQYRAVDQPVEFDHRHHVVDDEIDCLYCHSEAQRSDYAGVPATDVCMGCHAQIWNDSPLLETVRRSYFSGKPIAWNRVHDLGDFVYFNHAVHVNRGIGCVLCHGRVDQMARVYKAEPLTMGYCLDCHRDPASFMKTKLQELDFSERPVAQPVDISFWGLPIEEVEPRLPRAAREITPLTTCTACHR